MNDTVRTLSVFLLTCTLAVGSLLAIYLIVDKHYKARLAKDYAEIDSMKSDLDKTRALRLPAVLSASRIDTARSATLLRGRKESSETSAVLLREDKESSETSSVLLREDKGSSERSTSRI